jgi:hypothetical protein
MTRRPTTETIRTHRVEIVPHFDCTGYPVWIREELVQEDDKTIVVSHTVFRCPSVRPDNCNDVDHQQAQAAAVPAG